MIDTNIGHILEFNFKAMESKIKAHKRHDVHVSLYVQETVKIKQINSDLTVTVGSN